MTLYELNSLVADALADALPDTYWVQGELAEGRVGYGGHFYGELVQKDESGRTIVARARVNCWQRIYTLVSANFERETGESLRPGLKVMVEVKVTFHEQYGYSLTIVDIDPTYTLGDMALRRKQILEQLEADGILHDNQELPLPLLTRRIAVVSSATAAGYGDFCNQLEENEYGFHFSLKLFPAVMQGQHVEESVIAALDQIALEADKWDAVVIIRGGGAKLDLSDFDSYSLAACITQMPLPVITGIGHERDETVLDFVAHTRLKTPTAVAAFLIDRMAEQLSVLEDLQQRIMRSVANRTRNELQRINEYTTRLPLIVNNLKERNIHRIDQVCQRLESVVHTRLEREAHRLELYATRLKSVDPDLLLKRGYSITLVDGKLLCSVQQVSSGQTITTRLAEGEIKSIVQ